MAGTFTDFWRIVKPASAKTQYVASNTEAAKLYSNFSWYTKVMKGAASRFAKYNQYKNMDADVFVARALDTISEEMTQINPKTNLPFEIMYQNESNKEIPEAITMTIRAALRHWCDLQDFDVTLFDIARTTVKSGDCFFRKTSDFKRWQFVEPSDVIGVSLNEDGVIEQYHIRVGEKNRQGAFGDVVLVPGAGIVHFTLSSSMGENGPFGESVLFPTVKAFRHLSLLEDSVIIYRIVRAPERRVFFIDTGNMPPQRVKAYLEAIKTEMRQKRIPNEAGGTDKIDSIANPMGMVEDYFFAQTSEGRGSRVETLSGGESLGEIRDLAYFQSKFLQGLRIPSSYMRGGDDSGAQVTDGKVGIAYIEEQRFVNYVARLQIKLNNTFDDHFKAYLKSAGIKIDQHIFKIKLTDPQNFVKYKQAEIDEKLLNNFASVKDYKSMAERYKKKHYLGMSEDDIQEDEIMLKQERCIPDKLAPRLTDLRMMYDPAWTEKLPEIKIAEDYENFEDVTAKKAPEEEETDAESEGAPEGEGKGGEAKGDEAPPPEADKDAGGEDEAAPKDAPADDDPGGALDELK